MTGRNDDTVNFVSNQSREIEAPKATIDRFKLLLNYRDPFLTSYKKVNRRAGRSTQSNESAKEVRNVEQVVWPKLNYGGMIKNNTSKRKLALLGIGSRSFLLHEKDEEEGITVLKIMRDSILLDYKNEKKTFYK